MTTRRTFLAGLAAAGLCPRPTWADAGAPAYLSAARMPDGRYYLVGLTTRGGELFRLPIPARGHAAAAHPERPEAVAFARRPGTFAVVLDCVAGKQTALLAAPEGRHFYGHGTFSRDGSLLYTVENDYNTPRGVVSVWEVASGYLRLGEFPSGGIGPHDIRLMPDGETFVVANGGIETHPDSGRTKLNLGTMKPNLTYLQADGTILEQVELDHDIHRNSIRHLALAPDGLVAFAMQWEGDTAEHPPLVSTHRRGEAPRLFQAAEDVHREMRGYAGSVAYEDGKIAITSPRGGMVQVFDVETGDCTGVHKLADVCGLSSGPGGFTVTTGTGEVSGLGPTGLRWDTTLACQWDNHLVPIA